MTAAVGEYTQSAQFLFDLVRKNYAATEKRSVSGKGMRPRMDLGQGMGGMPMMGGRGGKSKSSRFRPSLFRKSDKSEPRSNGSSDAESLCAIHVHGSAVCVCGYVGTPV